VVYLHLLRHSAFHFLAFAVCVRLGKMGDLPQVDPSHFAPDKVKKVTVFRALPSLLVDRVLALANGASARWGAKLISCLSSFFCILDLT
jgi:hypothetical protein